MLQLNEDAAVEYLIIHLAEMFRLKIKSTNAIYNDSIGDRAMDKERYGKFHSELWYL